MDSAFKEKMGRVLVMAFGGSAAVLALGWLVQFYPH
jgi:hypothetical protein